MSTPRKCASCSRPAAFLSARCQACTEKNRRSHKRQRPHKHFAMALFPVTVSTDGGMVSVPLSPT